MKAEAIAISISIALLLAGCGVFNPEKPINWEQVDFPSSRPILTMKVHERDLFVGTMGDGAFVSHANEKTWTAINSGLTNLTVKAFEFSGGRVFAGTEGGVFVSDNAGASWSPANEGLSEIRIYALTIKDSIVYAGTEKGLFCSSSFGENWANIYNYTIENFHILEIAAINDYFFACDGMNIYKAHDPESTWAISYKMIDDYPSWHGRPTSIVGYNGCIFFCEARAIGPREAYFGAKIYCSEDTGSSWADIADLNAYDMTAANDILFVGASDAVYYSKDIGDSWIPLADNSFEKSAISNIISIAVFDTCIFAASAGDNQREYANYTSATTGKLWSRSISDLDGN